MTQFTFRTDAYVTLSADNEDEARADLMRLAAEQQNDVDYNGVMVYIDPYPDTDPILVDEFEERNE
jgi:hypothetical protein